MQHWLLTWNRDHFPWPELPELCERVGSGNYIRGVATGDRTGEFRWSCDRTKNVECGDRLILLKQGGGSRGVVGIASATEDGTYEGEHWSDAARTTRYVELQWELLVDPEVHSPLQRELLSDTTQQLACIWAARRGGNKVPEKAGIEIVNAMMSHIHIAFEELPGFGEWLARSQLDPSGSSSSALEGARREFIHRGRERRSLRRKKLDALRRDRGYISCEVCNYRSHVADLDSSPLEVHHLVPLSEGVRNTTLDDLSVLCANCHRLIHAAMRTQDKHVSVEMLCKMFD
jgi:hypothetical protein